MSAPSLPDPTDDAENDLGVLCPSCAFGNAPDADFCARCGAPFGTMSTLDPLRSTLAEGFVYRRAVEGSPKPIVVAGVWLIFLPMLAVPVLRVINGELHSAYDLALVGLIFLLAAAILYRTTAGFLRQRRAERAKGTEG